MRGKPMSANGELLHREVDAWTMIRKRHTHTHSHTERKRRAAFISSGIQSKQRAMPTVKLTGTSNNIWTYSNFISTSIVWVLPICLRFGCISEYRKVRETFTSISWRLPAAEIRCMCSCVGFTVSIALRSTTRYTLTYINVCQKAVGMKMRHQTPPYAQLSDVKFKTKLYTRPLNLYHIHDLWCPFRIRFIVVSENQLSFSWWRWKFE